MAEVASFFGTDSSMTHTRSREVTRGDRETKNPGQSGASGITCRMDSQVPLPQVALLAQRWYGSNANHDWRKWTVAEAQNIFHEARTHFGVLEPRRSKRKVLRLVQNRFLRETETIAWRAAVPKGRHESSAGRQSWVGRNSVPTGTTEGLSPVKARDPFPTKEPKLKSAVPSGLCPFFCNPTPHFMRGYFQPSRQMPGLITAVAGTFGQQIFNLPLPYDNLDRRCKAQHSFGQGNQNPFYPLIWTALKKF
jgi:hypothetical protein